MNLFFAQLYLAYNTVLDMFKLMENKLVITCLLVIDKDYQDQCCLKGLHMWIE